MLQLYLPFIHKGKTARLACADLSFTARSFEKGYYVEN
jgi:hypothetical protein